MCTDQTAAQFSRARMALQRLLQRVKDAAPRSARETLVEALCDGLRRDMNLLEARRFSRQVRSGFIRAT
jgi:hypothetical protein